MDSSFLTLQRDASGDDMSYFRQMLQDAQAKAYANEGAVLLIRNRIVELNESIETVRAEGNNVQEWEALLMIIHELERIVVNIPGYTDPARGKPDMSSVK